MVIVAKDNAEYLIKRDKLLKDYEDYAKMRQTYKKTKESYKETGMPLFPSVDEPKTTLEQLVDKSRVDENLVRLIMSDLDANVGQAKMFVQSLSSDLKQNLLERFAAFKSVFDKNFTIANEQSLQGAFEIFLKKSIYDAKPITPSKETIEEYLKTLSPKNLKEVARIVNDNNMKAGVGARKLLKPTTPITVKNVSIVFRTFIQSHKTDLIGFSALYTLLKNNGFNPPKPTLSARGFFYAQQCDFYASKCQCSISRSRFL